ncbi:Fe-S cluster assembly protein SufD [filamentous cyanobacterium CCP5]|nr:Fe-S cluster assembly protein SufD [filamentous cyanobacterium CCP5]
MGTSEARTQALSKSQQRDAYLAGLLEAARAAVPAELALADLRRTAEALVKEQTFPHGKQESWRFTDLSSMMAIPFKVADQPVGLDAAAIDPVVLPEAGARLVVVNGQVNETLSSTDRLPAGVIAGSLKTLWQDEAWRDHLLSHIGQQSGNHEVFTALNTAGFADAVVVWVPRGCVVEEPVHIIYASVPQAQPAMVQPRALVVAEANSALTLIEDFWGRGMGDHFTNAVSEIYVGANAQITHGRSQRETEATFHVGKTVVSQERDSRYRCTTVSLGGRCDRHHFEVYQQGPQTETQLHGLGVVKGQQLTDTQSLVALQHPHGTVNQLQKNIIDDQAHSVFSGRIIVPQAAQLTNATQMNRNLLLSAKGRVDTKPQLEIVADNVQCAHGATVSQLEADEIFYLQSRGIAPEQAQRMLIYAFAMEVLSSMPAASLRDTLSQTIAQLAEAS